MNHEQLITTKKMAALLGIAPITVQRLAARGEIPGVKVAGRWRFELKQVETYLSHRVDAEDTNHSSSILDALEAIRSELQAINENIKSLNREE
ncbi:MAG: helix-turn-helix domain-containing protein [Myxococcota bacterium]|nr:helix-turn-helix domain-containing protein [Myxococcota bacterium]